MSPFSIKNLRSLLFQHLQPPKSDSENQPFHYLALDDACNLAVAEFAPQWESPKLLLKNQVQLDRLNEPTKVWSKADRLTRI